LQKFNKHISIKNLPEKTIRIENNHILLLNKAAQACPVSQKLTLINNYGAIIVNLICKFSLQYLGFFRNDYWQRTKRLFILSTRLFAKPKAPRKDIF